MAFSKKLCAWPLIATLATPPLAWAAPPADYATLRQRGAGTEEVRAQLQAGLEEAVGRGVVTEPARGFAMKVDPEVRVGVQVAKREVGELEGRGVWQLVDGDVAFDGEPPGHISQVIGWARDGLRWLLQNRGRFPIVDKVWNQLQARGLVELPIEFLADHAMTMDFTDDDGSPMVRIDTTVAMELGDARYAQGRRIVYALNFLQDAAQAAGIPERHAIHLLLALYERLRPSEREALHEVLQSEHLDSGEQWNTFFEWATDGAMFQASLTESQQRRLKRFQLTNEQVHGIDTLELRERRKNTDLSKSERERIDRVIDFRDTMVAWLVGRLQYDIPFDYRRVKAIYFDPTKDADTKMDEIYAVVRNYVHEVEEANADRVSKQAAEAGQFIAGGRWSTAFRDTMLEVGSAKRVGVTDELRGAARELHDAAQQLVAEAGRTDDRTLQEAATSFLLRTEAFSGMVFRHGGMSEAQGWQFLDEEDGELEQGLEVFLVRRRRGVRSEQKVSRQSEEDPTLSRPGEVADTTTFYQARKDLWETVSSLEQLILKAREALSKASKTPYAKMVAIQRASPTGSRNFIHGMAFVPPPGQPQNLRLRWRYGGHNFWMTPDAQAWVKRLNYLIEFIPLYIGERKFLFKFPDGRQVVVRETDVDQQDLEVAVRGMADPFADGIELTEDTEYVALARECVCEVRLGNDVVDQVERARGVSREEAYRVAIREAPAARRPSLIEEVAIVAAWLAEQANTSEGAKDIDDRLVATWRGGRHISRYLALRNLFLGEPEGVPRYAEVVSHAQVAADAEARHRALEQYAPMALDVRQPTRMWVMGTTEAADLNLAVIYWLTHEMAMRNSIRATNHEGDVRKYLADYRQWLVQLGEIVLQEFGYERRIDAVAATRKLSREDAILAIVGENTTFQQEVAKLAVLRTWAERKESGYTFEVGLPDPAMVRARLDDPGLQSKIEAEARQLVWEHNRADLQRAVDRRMRDGESFDEALQVVIDQETVLGRRVYHEHWVAAQHWVARDLVIEELGLKVKVGRWYRDHTALARTTARQAVVAQFGLRELMTDLRYHYLSDGLWKEADGQLRSDPHKMRFLICGGPGQVDLEGEEGAGTQRKSIILWPQWVTVFSELGQEIATILFGGYHHRVEIRRADIAADFKVLKNADTAMGRAVTNLEAQVTYGDIEDFSVQRRLHGDLLANYFIVGLPDKAGATAGYCIPKDIKFKVWRGLLTEEGIIRAVHGELDDEQMKRLVKLGRYILAQRSAFDSFAEWERWAVQELIRADEAYRQVVDVFDDTGLVTYDITQLVRIIERMEPRAAWPQYIRDVYQKLTEVVAAIQLGDLEAVNRRESFGMVRDIFDGLKLARRLNPDVPIAPDRECSMLGAVAYKGTYGPLLADVRYSRVIQTAHVLAALAGVRPRTPGYERATEAFERDARKLLAPLTASLRPEDEPLIDLGLRGFRPESSDRVDLAVTRFVAETMLGVDQRTVEVLDGFKRELKLLKQDVPDYLDQVNDLVTKWIARVILENPEYQDQVKWLTEHLEPPTTLGRVTLIANPATAVRDVLEYISDGKELLNQWADEALAILLAHGLSRKEIQTRAQSGDPFHQWIAHLPQEEQEQIWAEVGGRFIPLMIREGGLVTDLWQGLTLGQDVLLFGLPYQPLVSANPAHLVQAMIRNRRHSGLLFLDHVTQGRARVWHAKGRWAPKVMRAMAAARAYDRHGNRIGRWKDRDAEGRKLVYSASSLRPGSPIVEDWRAVEARWESRAVGLFDVLEEVAGVDVGRRAETVDGALEAINRLVPLEVLERDYQEVLAYWEHADALMKSAEPFDEALARSLGVLYRGMSESQRHLGNPAYWLAWASPAEIAALGFMFLLNGESPERIQQDLGTIQRALAVIREELVDQRQVQLDTRFQARVSERQSADWASAMIEPGLHVEISERVAREVVVTAVKAPETVQRQLEGRAALMVEDLREIALGHRQAGYDAELRELLEAAAGLEEASLEAQWNRLPAAVRWHRVMTGVRRHLDDLLVAVREEDSDRVETLVGRVYQDMMRAAYAAVDLWIPQPERADWRRRISRLTEGRGLIESAWEMFVRSGGFLHVLFERAGDDPERREAAGALMELAHISLALEKLMPHMTLDRAFINEPAFWLDLSSFFEKTINDHFDEKLPWAFSTARGNGFEAYFDEQERLLHDRRATFDLYAFAWQHHQWLYRFLRHAIVAKTQLADWPEERVDDLLGLAYPGEEVFPAIGAEAPINDEALLRWRQYMKLHEVSAEAQMSVAMLQDTFRPLADRVGPVEHAMMPYVLTRPLDPALIRADEGVGVGIASGTGRRHYKFLEREGGNPALGDNVFITQYGRFFTPEGKEPSTQEEWDRAIYWIDSAHFWVSAETFRRVLIESEGMTPDEADGTIVAMRAAQQIHPKGVRLAGRFARPVAVGAVVTLHHHIDELNLMRAGKPATDKDPARILFDATYEKVLYDYIAKKFGVRYPEQENIYREDVVRDLDAERLEEARGTVRAAMLKLLTRLVFASFFTKGSRESGSRNLKAEDLQGEEQTPDPEKLEAAVDFALQVARGQNVVLSQDVSLCNSCQTFLTPEMVRHIRGRAIREFGVPVNLSAPGKADVTTVRVTMVSPHPDVPHEEAHLLIISSLTGDKATNLARQHVAEPLHKDFLQKALQGQFMDALLKEAHSAMTAMWKFCEEWWDHPVTLPDGRDIPSYAELFRRQYGFEPRKTDARGVPYAFPTWLMLDFVPVAAFKTLDGQPLKDVKLVDIAPGADGQSPRFWVESRDGNRIEAVVELHLINLIEWNSGIGQVPEVNRREQFWEYHRAMAEAVEAGQPGTWFERVQWHRVGEADRKVLKVWLTAGRQVRAAKGYPDRWPEAPVEPVWLGHWQERRRRLVARAETPRLPEDLLEASLTLAQRWLGRVPLAEETLSIWLVEYALQRLRSRGGFPRTPGGLQAPRNF